MLWVARGARGAIVLPLNCLLESEDTLEWVLEVGLACCCGDKDGLVAKDAVRGTGDPRVTEEAAEVFVTARGFNLRDGSSNKNEIMSGN